MLFGIHFLVDGYNAPEAVLKDKSLLEEALNKLPESMDMHKITEPQVVEVGPKNRKDPGGVSGVVLIAESHITFHTFPSRGFVTIDVYTCQDELDTEKLLQKLREIFQFKNEETHQIERGVSYPSEDIY